MTADSDSSETGRWRLAGLALVVLAVLAASYMFRDRLSLENLVQYEQQLYDLQSRNPAAVYAVAFFVYAAATGASLPGAAALTLFCGWYFGFWRGLVFVSFASTTGATLAFLVSRYLLRDVLTQKFESRVKAFDQALADEGPFYLFSLRLIPAVPFFVINAVMGLTQMKPRTFWWVSQLGMLPGTAVYVYAGSQFPSLEALAKNGVKDVISPSLLAAFVALGVFPLIARFLVKSLHGNRRA